VDARNPAPVGRWFIPLFLGFQPSKVVQDFFHPLYHTHSSHGMWQVKTLVHLISTLLFTPKSLGFMDVHSPEYCK